MPHVESTPDQPRPELVGYIDRDSWQQSMADARFGMVVLGPQTILQASAEDPLGAVKALTIAVKDAVETGQVDRDFDRYVERVKRSNSTGPRIIPGVNPFENATDKPDFHAEAVATLGDAGIRAFLRGRNLAADYYEFYENYADYRQTIIQGFRNGIAADFIPDYVGPRLDTTFQKTAVQIVDSALCSDGRAHGTYDPETDVVGLANGSEKLLTLAHEMKHQVSGGVFVTVLENGKPKTLRLRIGFSDAIKTGRYRRIGRTEAAAEHIALGVVHGDFATLDPDRRQDDSGIYYAYRKVNAVIHERAQGIIDPRTTMRASFEDGGPGGTIVDRSEMVRQHRAAYGPGVQRKIDMLMNASVTTSHDEVAEDILSRIEAPIVRGSRVIRTGALHVEDLPEDIAKYRAEQAKLAKQAMMAIDTRELAKYKSLMDGTRIRIW